MLTTKGSETPVRILTAEELSATSLARTSRRKGGFCPDSRASELPVHIHSEDFRKSLREYNLYAAKCKCIAVIGPRIPHYMVILEAAEEAAEVIHKGPNTQQGEQSYIHDSKHKRHS